MGRADLKKEAIERIDELIIGPMLAGLGALGDFAILLMPDHATPSQLKTHSTGAGAVRADDLGAIQVGRRRAASLYRSRRHRDRRTRRRRLSPDRIAVRRSLEDYIELTAEALDGAESCPRSCTRDRSRGAGGGAFHRQGRRADGGSRGVRRDAQDAQLGRDGRQNRDRRGQRGRRRVSLRGRNRRHRRRAPKSTSRSTRSKVRSSARPAAPTRCRASRWPSAARSCDAPTLTWTKSRADRSAAA